MDRLVTALDANQYLRKHQLAPLQVGDAPSAALGLVVVVPCRDEPGVLATLGDLAACRRPRGVDVEVLVVVNGSDADRPEVRARSAAGAAAVRRWAAGAAMTVHVLEHLDLPARRAGVGLARKLGMDEAVARLARAGCADGVIACLDADCRCDPNYLTAIAEHFRCHPESPACSVYFEHPLHGPGDPRLYEGIAHYELYLRYYRRGLAWAGLPYAHHSVGSCMAVRRLAYEAQGGMNRRKAAEDFHFLAKFVASGGVATLASTRVVPAVRVSSRVPFGTGRAQGDWLAGAARLAEPPEVFRDLAGLVAAGPALRGEARAAVAGLAAPLRDFLAREGLEPALAEMRANTASGTAFVKRFFRWFGPLRCLRYAHHASRAAYRREPVARAAATLLGWLGTPRPAVGVRALLERYRRLDRCAAPDGG